MSMTGGAISGSISATNASVSRPPAPVRPTLLSPMRSPTPRNASSSVNPSLTSRRCRTVWPTCRSWSRSRRCWFSRYAARLDRGQATTRDAAILKLYACEAYKEVSDLGLQVLGGYGYTMEHDLQRHFRDSRLGVIGAGTSDIQRNIIAKTMGI